MAALVADYGSDSSDSDSAETDDITNTNTKASNIKESSISLISASEILEQTVHGKSSSVFANPFLEAEKSQQSSLEKHVKMTSIKKEEKEKKNICYKFKKGKCTFGNKCKYYHPENITSDNAVVKNFPTKLLRNEADEESDVIQPKKKKYGLKNSLEPPKGYMKIYNKQKNIL